jgi:hypothetical protein
MIACSQTSHAFGKVKSGYYEGQLEVFQKFAETQDPQAPLAFYGTKLAAISIHRKGWNGTIEITDPAKNTPLMENISMTQALSPQGFHLFQMKMKIAGLDTQLNLRKAGVLHNRDCLKGHSSDGLYKAFVCMKKHELLKFDIHYSDGSPLMQLNAAPFFKPHLPSHGPLTLAQVIQIAKETSPASHQEFLQKRAAKLQVDIDWLRMLPRLNVPALASLWLPLPTAAKNYAQQIGTLAPFLSITAWENLDQARRDSQIADVGFKIFQANLVNQVEQSVYNYRKDITLMYDFRELLGWIKEAQNQMTKIQEIAQADSKFSHIDPAVIADLNQTLQVVRHLVVDNIPMNPIDEDKAALAQTLGIHDLELLRDLKIEKELPIENATRLDVEEEAAEAARISLKYMERYQARLATHAARANQIGHPFSLFDVAGSPTDGSGLNLIPEFQLDQTMVKMSQVNELLVADQLRFVVINAAFNNNSALKAYRNVHNGKLELHTTIYNLLRPVLEFDFDQPELAATSFNAIKGSTIERFVKDYIPFISESGGYQLAYRLARATLNRAKLTDVYEQFLPEKDRPHPPTPHPEYSTPSDDAIADKEPLDTRPQKFECYRIGKCEQEQQGQQRQQSEMVKK